MAKEREEIERQIQRQKQELELEILYNHVGKQLSRNRETKFLTQVNGVNFLVKIMAPDYENGINIPSVIIIPKTKKINNQIMLEGNNVETNIIKLLLDQAFQTRDRLIKITKDRPCPIIIPLLPSQEDPPYFQQLAKESFELSEDDENYRVDEQVVKIIDKTKKMLNEEYNIKAKDKVFLNGYSTSGVFAQRFSMIHPELVDIACIGGSSGSIPSLSTDIGYPIGIEDYEDLFGKPFDLKEYQKIKFRYYVGEFELANKAGDRFDEDNNKAPMHDMSYFTRSVPKEVGDKQRETLGRNLFVRADNTIAELQRLGINITHKVIEKRSHNNRCGIGVNELGDKFVNNVYRVSLKKEIERDEYSR